MKKPSKQLAAKKTSKVKAPMAVPPKKRSKGKPAAAPTASVGAASESGSDEATGAVGPTPTAANTEPTPAKAKPARNGKVAPAYLKKPRDPRLPEPGTLLHRGHGGMEHEITVLEQGFEYQGHLYKSLSKIAKEITGSTWNGFVWAGLGTKAKKAAEAAS